jgi:hypothetical protein
MIYYDKKIKISSCLINGYQYFCDNSHPLSNKNGYVYYHRHVASIKVGNWLTPSEYVHHKDGNKLNNDPDNLMILSNAEHSTLEQNIRGNFREINYCTKCGTKLANNRQKSVTGLCPKCYGLSKRKFDPSKEEFYQLIQKLPMIKIGKLYGVSETAIRKRRKLLNV